MQYPHKDWPSIHRLAFQAVCPLQGATERHEPSPLHAVPQPQAQAFLKPLMPASCPTSCPWCG